MLRLDRVRALADVYPGVDREDEMVAAFDYCLHGRGGAAPSIDTAMHGLVDTAHVDHLHPDSGIALATATDGEALTKECFGDRVVWVPWRRPGFQLGLEIAAVQHGQPRSDRRHPRRPRHHRMGRHERCVRGELARDHPHRRGVPRHSGRRRAVRAGRHRIRTTPRRCASSACCRARSGHPRVGVDRPRAGRPFHRCRRGARFLRPREAGAPGWSRHVVPRPLPPHQGPPTRARSPRHGAPRRGGGAFA